MSKLVYITVGIAVVFAAGFVLSPGRAPETVEPTPRAAGGEALVEVDVPAEITGAALMGERAFEAKCIACHGENGAGVNGAGPPLIHKIYEPGHHGDAAFWLATQNGVRAHHWKFGSMPPVDGLTRSDVDNIVAYIRTLQQTNGIF